MTRSHQMRPGVKPGEDSASRRAPARIERPAPALGPEQMLRRAQLLGHNLTSAVQRATYNDGPNQYDTEVFDTNRERPKTVAGKVRWISTAGRGGAPPAIARYNPTTGMYDPLLGYDGGHVLGLEAGGVDRSYNVVPMLPKFNRDTWRKAEQTLTGAAMFSYTGTNFRYTITLAYANGTAKIPDIPETKKVKGKSVKTGKVNLNQQVLNITKSQPGDIEVTAGPTQHESDTFSGIKPTAGKVVKELKKRQDYKTSGFLQYIATNHHLPVSHAQDYPDNPARRPYEHLDILALSNQVLSDSNFGPRREFSSLQRNLILKYNMSRNGGNLISDDPLDPHQNLSERGSADFPEVDHIVPKSQGGSNFFSNARLVSWQLNNKEDRVKDITPLIGIDRISYPALTSRSGFSAASERSSRKSTP
jgi:hypothetical protein